MVVQILFWKDSTVLTRIVGLLSQLSVTTGSEKFNWVWQLPAGKLICSALSILAKSPHCNTGGMASWTSINWVSKGIRTAGLVHRSVTDQILLMLSPQFVLVVFISKDNWKSQTISVSDNTMVSSAWNCPLMVNPVNNLGGSIGIISGLEKKSSQSILKSSIGISCSKEGRSIFKVSTRWIELPKSSVAAQMIKKSDWLLQPVLSVRMAVASIWAKDWPQKLDTAGLGKVEMICNKSKSQTVKV